MSDRTNFVVQHNNSKLRQAALRVGIVVERPGPRLPITEQEQTDTM